MELVTNVEALKVPPPARHQRVDGEARIAFDRRGLSDLYQRAPSRLLFPDVDDGEPPQAVSITTSGGLTGGDRIRVAMRVGEGASATLTSQAAEKLYRALDGDADTRILTQVEVADGGWGEWLGQETILFDGARVRRSFEADVAPGGRLLAVESLVFGRGAMGERMLSGRVHDAWSVRRAGRLIWVDRLRLDGDVAQQMERPFAMGGTISAATILYVGADAGEHLAAARALVEDARGGATSFDGMLIVRLLDSDPAALRRSVIRIVGGLRARIAGLSATLPKPWYC